MVIPLGDVEKTRILPVVTYALIAINVVVYLVQYDRGSEFELAFAVTPYEITNNVDLVDPVPVPVTVLERRHPFEAPVRRVDVRMQPQAPGPSPIWLTLLTAMFLHGSPLHLAGNMLYLWIFGDNVEEVLGSWRYVLVYLACGVIGSLAQIAAAPDSLIPTLGASGAIAGLMGAYVIWFPQNRIRVLVFRFITEMPALLVVGFWILMQVWEGFGSLGRVGQSGGVAYLAHVGGAVTGIFVALLFHDRADAFKRLVESREGWYYGP